MSNIDWKEIFIHFSEQIQPHFEKKTKNSLMYISSIKQYQNNST